ncbi:MAG: hypothetical protein ACLS9K_02685 [Lachnospira eligens]
MGSIYIGGFVENNLTEDVVLKDGVIFKVGKIEAGEIYQADFEMQRLLQRRLTV